MLTAVATAVAWTSVVYLFCPRMPFYQVTSLKLASVDIPWLLSSSKLSLIFRVGFSLENSNFIGVDVLETHADLYYPDWNGGLHYIGFLNATKPQHHQQEQNNNSKKKRSSRNSSDKDGGNAEEENAVAHSRSTGTSAVFAEADASADTLVELHRTAFDLPPGPSSEVLPSLIRIAPRRRTVSEADFVSVYIDNLPPKSYLRLLHDIISNGGTIHILSSIVTHVRSSLIIPVPVTVAVLCQTAIDLFTLPFQVRHQDCVFETLTYHGRRVKSPQTIVSHTGQQLKQKILEQYHQYVTKYLTTTNTRRRQEQQQQNEFSNITTTTYFNDGSWIQWHDF